MAATTAPVRTRHPEAAARPVPTLATAPTSPRPRPASGGPRRRRTARRAALASASVVLASLLAVVGANAYLTQGQVRLTDLQQQVDNASGLHRDLEARVARLSSPSTVVAEAEHDGLVPPTRITDLPEVTLPPTLSASSGASAGTNTESATR